MRHTQRHRIALLPIQSLVIRSRGIALIMVLIFLTVISGIVALSIRQSNTAEALARNQIDQQVARQAAESALRDAERDILFPSVTPLNNAICARGVTRLDYQNATVDCDQGMCLKESSDYLKSQWSTATATNAQDAEPWWPKSKGGRWNDTETDKPIARQSSTSGKCATFKGGVPLGVYTGAPPIQGVAKQPEYLVEVYRRKNIRLNQAETQVTGSGENPGGWSTMYRITARGFGNSLRTQVVLQTILFP